MLEQVEVELIGEVEEELVEEGRGEGNMEELSFTTVDDVQQSTSYFSVSLEPKMTRHFRLRSLKSIQPVHYSTIEVVSSDLKKHTNTHSGNRPFTCNVCKKSFTRSYSLKTHNRIHRGKKSRDTTSLDTFLETVCLDLATSSLYLEKSEERMSEQQEVVVELGEVEDELVEELRGEGNMEELSFTTVDDVQQDTKNFSVSLEPKMTRHFRVRSQKSTQQVHYSTIVSSDIKTHIKTHKKDYTCRQCEKSLTRLGNLRTHNQIHSGEKPYPCKQCDKSFTQSGSLMTHNKIHSGEKHYTCNSV